ncbi:arylsulfatase B-like [Watersipora subatra]|uniref:arylsulfatase B-like n=1 Tax=Watersipora subatra TaxID=2589382 RepID=UPI00355B1161
MELWSMVTPQIQLKIKQLYAKSQSFSYELTRSAFLTGRYPSNSGLQLLVIIQEAQSCLPVEHKTLYEYIKDEGYVTKQVAEESVLQRLVDGSASTAYIRTHLAMFASYDFLDENVLETRLRRRYLGLVSAFDNIVGRTMNALKDADLDDNTIIIFSSDNGGTGTSATFGGLEYYDNNYPLRNGKNSYTEGGVRTPIIYYDPRLPSMTRGSTRDFLIHASDWLRTFVELGKHNPNQKIIFGGIDEKSQVSNLQSTYNNPATRKYLVRSEMLVALFDATGDINNPSECATEDAAYRYREKHNTPVYSQ